MSDGSTALYPERPDRDGGGFWDKAPQGTGASGLDPLAHLRSVLQYKWPIIAFTAIATALAIAYVSTATPLYRSTQSLLLGSTRSNIVAVEELIEEAPEDVGYVQTQIELLRSKDIVERVIDSLELLAEPAFVAGLAEHAGVAPERLDAGSDGAAPDGAVPDGAVPNGALPGERPLGAARTRALAVEFLLSRLSVNAVPTTHLLRIAFLSPDAELAASVANEIGLQYILDHAESTRSLVDEASGWLGERLTELEATLEASETRLLAFKRENGLVDIDEGGIGRLTEQELLQSSAELSETRLELADVSDRLRELRAETTTGGLLSRLPALSGDPLIQQTRADIARLGGEIERLANQYGPRHPRRVELRSERDALQGVLRRSVEQSIAALENERRLLARKVTALESDLAAGKRAIQDVDVQSVELAALEAEVRTNRDLYYRFFERMIESRSTQGLEAVNATVVERATLALEPAEPDKAFVVALTAVGALLAATLAAMIVGALDDSVRRPSSVEARLGVRLLGIVPTHRRSRGPLERLLPGRAAHERSNRVFLEAFRSIRTQLVLGEPAGTGSKRVLLLTSSVPREGKSTSAVCLARSFSRIERVLLIDADLRRPSLAKALQLPPEAPGLSSLLERSADVPDCIRYHRVGGFDVLPSGPPTERPLELLSSPRLGTVLKELARLYDRIIIDCAPVEAVSDALPLGRLCDAVIYVIKSHDTSQRLAARGLDKLRAAGAPLAGVLLTQVDLDKLAAYGADQEFHGYYDRYDYAAPTPSRTGPEPARRPAAAAAAGGRPVARPSAHA